MFTCAITSQPLKDPVVARDGHTYEREAISKWFETNHTSPLTGARLPDLSLVPNYILFPYTAATVVTAVAKEEPPRKRCGNILHIYLSLGEGRTAAGYRELKRANPDHPDIVQAGNEYYEMMAQWEKEMAEYRLRTQDYSDLKTKQPQRNIILTGQQ